MAWAGLEPARSGKLGHAGEAWPCPMWDWLGRAGSSSGLDLKRTPVADAERKAGWQDASGQCLTSDRVTAGFRWQPLTWPMEKAATIMAADRALKTPTQTVVDRAKPITKGTTKPRLLAPQRCSTVLTHSKGKRSHDAKG
jgi:cell envelope opacity-associated protein A